MKYAFLTESPFSGKTPLNHPNLRTDLAWQAALEADHFNLFQYEQVKGYDVIFTIFPKALLKLNMVGLEMEHINNQRDTDNIKIYSLPVVETLKKNNGKVCNIQEGSTSVFNDYDVVTQFNYYNQLADCDILFAHNEYDTHFFKGMFPQTKVAVMPSLMIVSMATVPDVIKTEEKTIIGGNFCHWYGGFQSYITATEFGCPIYVPSSHCKRKGEEQVPGLEHLPWVMWSEWMVQLSHFKYAVNLMPTIAAGTFSMNCGYFGIPCIGNEKADTQQLCFPELCVDASDVYHARSLAIQLKQDHDFYEHISHYAKKKVMDSWHVDTTKWIKHIESVL